jgi:hypothetical protein
MRRNREDQPDFAHIGGETDTATHKRKIARPARAPKRLDSAEGQWHSRRERKRNTQCQATRAK